LALSPIHNKFVEKSIRGTLACYKSAFTAKGDFRLPMISGTEHFDIHASVVFQLGESLITDSVQALVELVKNSYDADASYCKLTISTEKLADPESTFRGAAGSITIEDDGTGMTLEGIRQGWLTISNSEKRDLKDRTLTTKKGRTPLGDKGLGRLGTQRLGVNVELFTRTQNSPVEHHVWFSWKDFVGQNRLSDVDISRDDRSPTLKHGTKLVISDLRELSLWKGNAVKQLETSLSQLISPYKEVRDFVVYAVVDGKELELMEISEKLRQSAQLRYQINFDRALLRIIGRARLSYVRPERAQDKAIFTDLVESDDGQRFFDFLKHTKAATQFSFEELNQGGWFVGYKTVRGFDDFDGLELADGRPANPGPFKGEVDFFSLDIQSISEQSAFDTASEYRQAINSLSGIKVFRDGFGIRVASDWLGLGKQWTKGGSYYTLKPQNTLGYIAITARDNRQIEETTDREGFKGSPYYKNFYNLLTYFVRFSGQAQEALRRGWIDFRKAAERKVASVPEDTRPEALSATIGQALAKAIRYSTVLSQAFLRVRSSVSKSRETLEGQRNGDAHVLENLLNDLMGTIADAEKISKEVQEYLDEVARLEKVGNVLTSQIQTLRDQIRQVHEIIGLGLTAEALSHETENITTQLAQRNKQLVRHLRSNAIRDPKIVSFTEYVNTTVAGLRRQLLFLAPSLRYVREKREVIDLDEFSSELFKHYTMHFSSISAPISVSLKAKKGQHFQVEMNKGKLIQIMDNLFLNSEYWLLEDKRLGRLSLGTITLEIAKPYIRISDNGRGVDPAVESTLFEPFVSAKSEGKGRGLGLYIVQQLLDSEGCTIRLMPQRNAYGRMFMFEIDLTGALRDKH
jgi:signal transduction histidine kinase